MNNINEFISKSFAYIRNSFNRKMRDEFDFCDVYPYIAIDCKEYDNVEIFDNSTYDCIGKLYETNDKLQYRHLTRLLNTNFMPDDLFVTLHYSLYNRPTDGETAKKQLTAFLRKLKRLYKKYGIELKYIKVTAIGSKGAIHHHIVINSGVPYSEITKLWSYSDRTPDYKPLYANGEYSALAYYLVNQSKVGQCVADKISGKGFVGSRNLKQPEIIKEQYVDKVCWKEPPRAKKRLYYRP